MKYRETGHERETPSAFFIRKTELLNIVYSLSNSQVIMEVMGSAPADWATIINTQLCENVVEFQGSIRYHEDSLMRLPSSYRSRFRNYSSNRPEVNPGPASNQRTYVAETRQEESRKYPYPKDDTNVSKGRTPAMKGLSPCMNCGSGNHWSRECKFWAKRPTTARTRLSSCTMEELEEMDAHDTGYLEEIEESEGESKN